MKPGQTVALVASCVFFMACSCGMMILNKMVLRAAMLPITLVVVQMAFTVLALVVTSWRTLHFGSARDVRRWACTVPLLFAGVDHPADA